MWPFRRQPTVEDLRGYKKITVSGMRFTIKKIRPLLDFTSDKIPQIFTDFQSVRDTPSLEANPERLKKLQEDMYAIILAGVVEPVLVPVGKNGLTPEDLFRDADIGIGLYQAILEHAFNNFKGLKKLFFSIKTKYKSYITWQKLSGHYRTVFYSRMGTKAI